MLDLIVFFLLAVGISYGIIIKRRQIMVVMMSAYFSFFWVDVVMRGLLGNEKLIVFGKSDIAYVVSFLGLVAVVSIWSSIDGINGKAKGLVKLVLNGVFGVVGISLLILLILLLITPDLRNSLLNDSDLLTKMYDQKEILLSLPVVLLLITGFKNRRQ